MNKKLFKHFFLLLLCMVTTGAWADDTPTLEVLTSSQSETNNFLRAYDGGVTLSSTFSIANESSYGGYVLKVANSGNNNSQNYLEVLATSGTIEKVSFYVTAGSNGQTVTPAILGWKGDVASETTADYVDASQSAGGSGKRKDISYAEWITYDLSNAGLDLTRIRFYRQVKSIVVGNQAKANYGNAQTPWIWGVKVWVKADGPKDPVFSLSKSTIEVGESAKILLDGKEVNLSDYFYILSKWWASAAGDYISISLTDGTVTGLAVTPEDYHFTFHSRPKDTSVYKECWGDDNNVYINVIAARVDPTFAVANTTIDQGGTTKIVVSGKNNLDGITLASATSSDETIATVDATTGVITGVGPGTATITFSTNQSDAYNAVENATVTVTVSNLIVPVITAPKTMLKKGERIVLLVNGQPWPTDATAPQIDFSNSYFYTDYIDVDANGGVTGVGVTDPNTSSTVQLKTLGNNKYSAGEFTGYFKVFEPSELAEISEETTWDWSKLQSYTATGNSGIQLTDTSSPTKNEEFVFADLPKYGQTITIPSDFNAQAIAFKGEFPIRNKAFAQNGVVKFKTTVPGVITVDFSDTGNSGSAYERYLNVNGTNTEYYTMRTGSANGRLVSGEIAVAAGEVAITGKREDGTSNASINIYKITFTPKAVEADKYVQVKSTSELADGDEFILVSKNGNDYYAMNGSFEGVKLTQNDDNTLNDADATQKLNFQASPKAFKMGNQYVGSTDEGALKVTSSASKGNGSVLSEFSITAGDVTAKFNGYDSDYEEFNQALRYNATTNKFYTHVGLGYSGTVVFIYKKYVEPKTLTLTAEKVTVEVGKTATPVITATYTEDNEEKVATGLTYLYTVSDAASEYVEVENGNVKGLKVTPNNATITVKFNGNTEFAAAETTLEVQVIPVQKQDITLTADPEEVTVKVGKTVQLNVTAKAGNQTVDGLTYEYDFANSQSYISVDDNGLLTGIAENGTNFCAVIVTFAGNDNYNAANVSIPVTVEALAQLSILVNPMEMTVGETKKIDFTAQDGATGNTVDGLTFTYTVADGCEDILSVDAQGNVTALAAGVGMVDVNFAGNDTYAETSSEVQVTVAAPEPVEAVEYALVTSKDELANDDEIIIVRKDGSNYYALGNAGAGVTIAAADAENTVKVETADVLKLTYADNGTHLKTADGKYLATEIPASEYAQGSLTTKTVAESLNGTYIATFAISTSDGTTLAFRGESYTSSLYVKYGNGKFYTTGSQYSGSSIAVYKKVEKTADADLTLTDADGNETNAEKINALNDKEGLSVQVNRSVKASQWNTIYLPFAMTAEQIAAAFGEGTQVAAYSAFEGGDLKFTTVTATAANTAYLIKPANDVDEFTVEDVTVVASNDVDPQNPFIIPLQGHASFLGFLDNKTIEAPVPNIYYIANGNKIKKLAATGGSLKALHGYFILGAADDEDFGGEFGANTLTFSVDGEATGIFSIENGNQLFNDGEMYTLAGQRVRSSYKGVVIVNGKKVIKK